MVICLYSRGLLRKMRLAEEKVALVCPVLKWCEERGTLVVSLQAASRAPRAAVGNGAASKASFGGREERKVVSPAPLRGLFAPLRTLL